MSSPIETVAVLGAGTMGQGIAQVCAMSGFPTQLFDIDNSLSQKAISSISVNLDKAVSKSKITESQKALVLSRISIANRLEDIKADLVVEAVVERLDVKQQLFRVLEMNSNESAILASNTSSLSITEIASGLRNPQQFVGLHFFNPATLMNLVEVVRGASTKETVISTMMDFAKSLNKTAVLVKDSPGFIVNRVARHYYVEVLKLLEEGVASHEQIDALLRNAGFKMGPFELMDLIGMDINFAVTSSLYQAFHQDPKFRPSRIQQQKVMAGHLGRKTGKGFYEYTK
ncbi:MAG: 3-hydroxyacyl-CoA dehydrogenase NAD-binding domain-containing protein [Cyclobacteriaceae bacterium]|nr:3-hydroxyacyl-CoA dehydrogenase NAD-binding domain-containing protein [Cyclobacteriaceae bacterium]